MFTCCKRPLLGGILNFRLEKSSDIELPKEDIGLLKTVYRQTVEVGQNSRFTPKPKYSQEKGMLK